MDFQIITDTAGSRVGELASELRDYLEPRINKKYSDIDIQILVGWRCLPEAYNRRSFIRYEKKSKCLIIDISVKVEEYSKMYKVEQRFHIGNLFMEYLRKALGKNRIEGLDSEEFIEDVIKWGKEITLEMDYAPRKRDNWFSDEIDWSADWDK
ncbi:hypothetical protein [Anaerosporobacter sp.]|uniref:hypothetical protein n=1 Tax=Anaerosporobacter sp. TaxID=1872529 RepID=UPI00286F83CE|nr:hypothetical protein [Anaerosporobacter sp.]